MGAAASFHTYQARFHPGKKSHHILPTDLLSQTNAAMTINSVYCKHILGKINAAGRSLHGVAPSR
jgi:hypothetical protein